MAQDGRAIWWQQTHADDPKVGDYSGGQYIVVVVVVTNQLGAVTSGSCK